MGLRLGAERTGVVELTLFPKTSSPPFPPLMPRPRLSAALFAKRANDDPADDDPVLNFRKHYRLPKKPIVRCPECGAEHRGKCFFLRRSSRAKVTHSPAQVREFVDAARQRRHEAAIRRVVKRLIKELSNGIDEGRRAARRADRWTPETKKSGRPAGRRNLGLAKKDSES